MCAASVMVILSVSCLWMRKKFTKERGDYRTNEAKDAEKYDTADAAIVMGKTGQPEYHPKPEYYI